jgi:hypothetical protein
MKRPVRHHSGAARIAIESNAGGKTMSRPAGASSPKSESVCVLQAFVAAS